MKTCYNDLRFVSDVKSYSKALLGYALLLVNCYLICELAVAKYVTNLIYVR